MVYRILPWILDQERDQLKLVEKRWRPTDLLLVPQAQILLKDITWRYKTLATALDEMQSLDRGSLYIKYLTRMRLYLRQAHYNWKADQLVFLRAVAGLYTDYGAVLRLLKEDSVRGKLTGSE